MTYNLGIRRLHISKNYNEYVKVHTFNTSEWDIVATFLLHVHNN